MFRIPFNRIRIMDTEYSMEAVGIRKYPKSGFTSCRISAITPRDDRVMINAVRVAQLYLEQSDTWSYICRMQSSL